MQQINKEQKRNSNRYNRDFEIKRMLGRATKKIETLIKAF